MRSPIQPDWAAVGAETTTLLSQYLQVNTTNPPGNEARAAEFLADWLHDRQLEPEIYVSAPGRANLVVRLKGSGEAGPILLYHHSDVVPADPARWSTDPFSGEVREGYVYGRGALDIKGLGALHLVGLHWLNQAGLRLKRDVILLAGADEEMCGAVGARWMLDHQRAAINAEVVWDEGGYGLTGLLGSQPVFSLAVAEKRCLGIRLVATGTPGHASVPHGDNPVERLAQAIDRLLRHPAPAHLTPAVAEALRRLAPQRNRLEAWALRQAHRPGIWPVVQRRLAKDSTFNAMIRNTMSVTMLNAGYKTNLIPEQATAYIDARLLPDQDPRAFVAGLEKAIRDPKVKVEVTEWPDVSPPSPVHGPLIAAFDAVLPHIWPGAMMMPFLTPGATDSRFFRQAGMASYGLMPIVVEPSELDRIHGIDERVSVENLRLGAQAVYETLVQVAS